MKRERDEAKPWVPPEILKDPQPERRKGPVPATEAQIDDICMRYAETMAGRGIECDLASLRQMACILDAWRVAFGSVLKC